MNTEQILIIKHGALGDMILATGPIKAIRQHHPTAHIVLLTTKPYARLMADCPFIDDVWIDRKPKAWQLGVIAALTKSLNSRGFSWVYDLQTSQRSTRYFKLFVKPKPRFSGLAKGASHRHHTAERTRMHTIDRQKQQLAIAGITDVPEPDISWMGADVSDIRPNAPYILLVAGGSAHRPEKRWPAEYFSALAVHILQAGMTPVLIGTGAEATLLHEIESSVGDGASGIVNLCNHTSFAQLAELARGAAFAVGNDTGPMHIIAAAGCPSVVLFNLQASNPALCAPRGAHVQVMAADDLQTVKPAAIIDVLPASVAA